MTGVGPVSAMFDSSMCLVLILSSSLSIELLALVWDIVYFSINKKITNATLTVDQKYLHSTACEQVS